MDDGPEILEEDENKTDEGIKEDEEEDDEDTQPGGPSEDDGA